MTYRGTTNRNQRGSSYTRRVRKLWMLTTFGDGVHALCSFCGLVLCFETITADRYPTPGCEGGTYVRGNIRPSCYKCNASEGGKLGNKRKRAGDKQMTPTEGVDG